MTGQMPAARADDRQDAAVDCLALTERAFQLLVDRLRGRGRWTKAAEEHLAAVSSTERYGRRQLILAAGTHAGLAIVWRGFVISCQKTGADRRQIVDWHAAGDVINIEALRGQAGESDLFATHFAELAWVDPRLIDFAASRSEFQAAVQDGLLGEIERSKRHILSMGRRDSQTRVAHFLCAATLRFFRGQDPHEQTFQLPMTQTDLADHLGITAVHCNRILKRLADVDAIALQRHDLRIVDWPLLAQLGDFELGREET